MTEALPTVEASLEAVGFIKDIYQEGASAQALVHVETGGRLVNPFEKPENQDIKLVLDGFKKDRENIIFVNPNHGNEPYILGVNIALSINQILRQNGYPEAEIVVPLLYPGRQEKILKEEFGVQAGRIHMDKDAGDLMQVTKFGQSQYADHLQKLSLYNVQLHEQVRDHLSRDFRVATLANGETREFNGRNVVLDINTGSRFPATDSSYFAFPVLLSDLLRETLKTDLPFNKKLLEQVQKQAMDFEAGYKMRFIPETHTFSYQGSDFDGQGKEFTPPLKHPITDPTKVDREGIYVMVSGTGSGVDYVMQSASDLGLEVFHSPFISMETGTAMLPDVIYHPQIKAVFGRMGWGTGWICQQAEKPFIVIPHLPDDDPEIYFNLKTLEAARLGKIYEGQADVVREALSLTGDIKRLNNFVMRKYGTLDGVDYIANKIVSNLNDRRMRQFPTI